LQLSVPLLEIAGTQNSLITITIRNRIQCATSTVVMLGMMINTWT
jgi:hypothetical protein